MNRPHMPDSGLSFHNGRVQADLRTRSVYEGCQAVLLGGRSLDLRVALVDRRSRVANVAELLQAAWPGQAVEANNLQVKVNGLRKLFGAQANTAVRGLEFVEQLAPGLPVLAELPGVTRPASGLTLRCHRIPKHVPQDHSHGDQDGGRAVAAGTPTGLGPAAL